MEQINWNAFTMYFSPDFNIDYNIVLKNWRQKMKEFNGKTKPMLEFDVEMINGDVVENTLIFSVSGGNALRFKDIIDRARKANYTSINVMINRQRDKKLEVTDMRLVQKIINKGGNYGNDRNQQITNC